MASPCEPRALYYTVSMYEIKRIIFRPPTTIELGCLLTLAQGRACPNEIACNISHGRLSPQKTSAAAVTRALERLGFQGFVSVIDKDAATRTKRYILTSTGENILAAELERLADLVAEGRALLSMRYREGYDPLFVT